MYKVEEKKLKKKKKVKNIKSKSGKRKEKPHKQKAMKKVQIYQESGKPNELYSELKKKKNHSHWI